MIFIITEEMLILYTTNDEQKMNEKYFLTIFLASYEIKL